MSAGRSAMEDSADMLIDAAHVLIAMVKIVEVTEKDRATGAKLTIEVGLAGGGVEEWEITIERTASSH
jgi:hypothetical protein